MLTGLTIIIAASITAIGAIVAAILHVEELRRPVVSYIKNNLSQISLIIIIVLIILLIFLCNKLNVQEELRKEKEKIYELSIEQLTNIYEERIVQLTESITQLTESIKREKDNYSNALKKISELTTERDNLNEKINQSEKEVERLNKEIVEMKRKGEQVDYLESQLIEKKREIALLKQERFKLSSELEMTKEQLKNSKEVFGKLEKDLAKLEQEIITYVPESKVLKPKVDSLRNVIKGIKDETRHPELIKVPKGDSIVKSLPAPNIGGKRGKPGETHPPSLRPILRNQPNDLKRDEMIKMLRKNDFFDAKWNKQGNGFDNQFEIKIIKNNTLIIDHVSGLMWQQGGSPDGYMKLEDAKKYIEEINQRRLAGFNNWRLPTLEEAMSLMEKERNNDDMYIDAVFNKKQKSIWTCDLCEGGSAWGVDFTSGYCGATSMFIYNIYVRAVRSGQ